MYEFELQTIDIHWFRQNKSKSTIYLKIILKMFDNEKSNYFTNVIFVKTRYCLCY